MAESAVLESGAPVAAEAAHPSAPSTPDPVAPPATSDQAPPPSEATPADPLATLTKEQVKALIAQHPDAREEVNLAVRDALNAQEAKRQRDQREAEIRQRKAELLAQAERVLQGNDYEAVEALGRQSAQQIVRTQAEQEIADDPNTQKMIVYGAVQQSREHPGIKGLIPKAALDAAEAAPTLGDYWAVALHEAVKAGALVPKAEVDKLVAAAEAKGRQERLGAAPAPDVSRSDGPPPSDDGGLGRISQLTQRARSNGGLSTSERKELETLMSRHRS